jgi:hypothetical protein
MGKDGSTSLPLTYSNAKAIILHPPLLLPQDHQNPTRVTNAAPLYQRKAF